MSHSPALWAGTDEQRLEHHVRQRLVEHPGTFDGLVCFAHRGQGVRRFVGVFATRDDPRPFFDPDALADTIADIGDDAVDQGVPDPTVEGRW